MADIHWTTGVDEGTQTGSFGNATLQSTADRKIAFSIATHITVPENINGEVEAIAFIENRLLTGIGVSFEVQIGPADEL